jgi:hypothetical protein
MAGQWNPRKIFLKIFPVRRKKELCDEKLSIRGVLNQPTYTLPINFNTEATIVAYVPLRRPSGAVFYAREVWWATGGHSAGETGVRMKNANRSQAFGSPFPGGIGYYGHLPEDGASRSRELFHW